MKKLLVLFLFNTLFFGVKAQVVIKPGSEIIKTEWLKPSHDFYRCQVKDTAGNLTYDFMMEDFTSVDSVKKQITFARYRQVPKGSFSTDTSVTDLQFKPIRMSEVHYQKDVSYDMQFSSDKALVNTIKKGALSSKEYSMQPGYFEDNMIEYIIGYLDLKNGVTYKLDNFNKDTPMPSDPYLICAAFEDTKNIASDHTLNYKVFQFTHGNTKGYIWVDKSTHLVDKLIGCTTSGSYVVTKI